MNPIISIIIVTWNNQEHIAQAIDSCLSVDFSDCELIIINNNSSDNTSKIISQTTRNKYRIKIINNSKNEGLGRARNLGIKYAIGEYLLFLDGDDWYQPTAIKTVKNLVELRKPDILMFNHQRVWPNFDKQPNIPNRYVNLNRDEKDISSPENRNLAIRNLHVAWNKAYKRNFIKDIDIAFQDGFYEDIFWSISLFTEAKSIYYTGEILVNYRQRFGSITNQFNKKHFDIFEQYEKTINRLSASPKENSIYFENIYKYAESQIYGLLNTRKRIPIYLEYEYIRKARTLLSSWKEKLLI